MTKLPITPKLTAGEPRAVAAATDGDATSQHDGLAGERDRHAASEKSVGTNLLGAHDDLGRDRAALEPGTASVTQARRGMRPARKRPDHALALRSWILTRTTAATDTGHIRSGWRLPEADPAYRGQRHYTPFFLRYVYEPLVLRYSNRFAWRCPTSELIRDYSRHVGPVHLDVGPGTGYFLERCRWPVDKPAITLLDVNPDVLSFAAQRLGRYEPRLCQANVLDRVPLAPASYDWIGLNFVLHCLPGSLETKWMVLDHLAPLLRPGGILFGSTILGSGVPQTRRSALQLRLLNGNGAFSNLEDDGDTLKRALQSVFITSQVRVTGAVARFAARGRRAPTNQAGHAEFVRGAAASGHRRDDRGHGTRDEHNE